MSILTQSLRTVSGFSIDVLRRLRYVIITLVAIGIGVGIGSVTNDADTIAIVISIAVITSLFFLIIARPVNGLLALLFFMVFIDHWVEIPMGQGIPDLNFSRFFLFFTSVILLAWAAIGKFKFTRIGWVEIFAVATVMGIASAATLTTTPSPVNVIQNTLTNQLTPLFIYFFAKNLVRNRTELYQVLWVIAILGAFTGLYALYEYSTGHVLFVQKDKDVTRLFRGGTNIRLIVGIMGGSGQMGRAMAAIIPVTFYLFLEHKKADLGKLLLIIMLVFQFGGLIVPLSRTPWYATLLALFVMQLFYPQFRKLFIIIGIVGAVVIFGTWDSVSQSQAASRLDDDGEGLEGREARWNAGWNMFMSKPIRGWGFGKYETNSGRFRTDGSRSNFDAIESDYLHIMVATGLIGIAPYLLYIASILIYSWRLFLRVRLPEWSGFIKTGTLTVVWAMIICLMVTSYTARQVQPVIKLITFAVAGAVVGSHEYILRKPKDSLEDYEKA
ncbi:MAG: O-antigen ligase family protein [Chloroflexota bacterium]